MERDRRPVGGITMTGPCPTANTRARWTGVVYEDGTGRGSYDCGVRGINGTWTITRASGASSFDFEFDPVVAGLGLAAVIVVIALISGRSTRTPAPSPAPPTPQAASGQSTPRSGGLSGQRPPAPVLRAPTRAFAQTFANATEGDLVGFRVDPLFGRFENGVQIISRVGGMTVRYLHSTGTF